MGEDLVDLAVLGFDDPELAIDVLLGDRRLVGRRGKGD